MFFETWYQGILFGIITTLGMLVVVFALMSMWKKYEDRPLNTGLDQRRAKHLHL